ncbi:provisional ortholog of interferon induced protein with tetratricopeptide repeats 5 S homeolog isoform X1 [Xenopus laevis]|uniref:LOC495383 protein n=2 Tax=Xenopus laevis TaxID=8355 RepID=Q5U533_XENLA|nr:provisional ortholog of interferon induced protein with tetratricopeptide repeats 5 S homeolog [Xenopus laevis]XP_041426477.1 provisional ortholog of interferon induced protein with tetratricopeptide repeats 5 S homeolog isoform X1 [Xenopus laevis]XP_041426478.1 provisional ortholog of interferon induced protein with tetratricopeptide repeats 5 S homeolog isoform X1 [Xenopus laevis]AAH84851.1 LOC495383 protein [Xenopus laevis]OCT70116.1 hypothetical protein XELAEV_18037037mg [Xenopus laevis]
MSDLPEESLKNALLNLKCHFTWTVDMEAVADIDNIEDGLHHQIAFLPSIPRHRLHNLLSYTNYLKGDNEEAIRQLQEAEQHLQGTQSVDIKRAVTYSNYAWLYYHLNQFSNAQSYLERVEAIYNNYDSSPEHDILLTEIYGERAWALLTFYGKNCERAKEWFEKALELDPHNPELNSGYATVMYRLENQDNRFYANNNCECLELLKRAVTLNENDSVIKALLALKYHYLGRGEEGETIMEEALRQTPDSPDLIRHAAKFYRREGKIDYAITILKKALEKTPTSCHLHYEIGLCYEQKMNMFVSLATSHFEKVLQYKKRFVDAYIHLAKMYVKQNQFKKAEDTFQKGLNLENLTCEDKQEIHYHYAVFKQYQCGSESEAISHYKEVLMIPNKTSVRSKSKNKLEQLAKRRQDSSDATGFGLLGFIHQQEGEISQAIDYYERALELDPDNEEYMSALHYMRLNE